MVSSSGLRVVPHHSLALAGDVVDPDFLVNGNSKSPLFAHVRGIGHNVPQRVIRPDTVSFLYPAKPPLRFEVACRGQDTLLIELLCNLA